MAADPEFLSHLTDLFSGYGPIRAGRLFGGTSLYIDDAMFAVVFADTVYMKSDKTTRARFDEAGSVPFSYETKSGERVIPGLMSLPESALDDPDEAQEWMEVSMVPARKAAAKRRRT
ncbi:MAG: competence protein TfoX [Rhodobacteraceae bacterium]|nr:competence protein TfoX [Paracoccaceae bacterium]